ncbi:MAG: SpoIIE family protein phosphatase [Bacteroidetes bacterium]|nr:SpoIIE family protein phosphatase [Bacteroidota bacterium]
MIVTDSLKIKRNLNALVEFSKAINSSLDLKFILNNVLLTCMGKFLATKGAIAINEKGVIKLMISKGVSADFEENFPVITVKDVINESGKLKSITDSGSFVCSEFIQASEKHIGIIFLGEKLNKTLYSNEDIQFLKTILNISATAIQNSMVINELKQVNRTLDTRINSLNSLFELSKEFGLFSESTKVSKLLIYSIIGQFMISKYAVLIFEKDGINIIESKFPMDEIKSILNNTDVESIISTVEKNKLEKQYNSLFEIGVEQVVPMQIQGKTKGLILLGNRLNKQQFTESDIEFIYSVGSLAIISLENKRLFKEELEKHKLEEELDLAREIQRNLLPQEIVQLHNFEISAENISSNQVGGDYFDVIRKDEENCYIAIADVSGKGVPAALLMANLQALLKSACRQNISLVEGTGMINDLISENVTGGKFITFFWASINDKNRTISYVNAGHNPPLLVRDGKIIKLRKGGMILGVMKTKDPYITETLQLQKNDLLVFFTDGITEAMNNEQNEYSDERLEKLVLSLNNKSSKEVLKLIQADVKNFTSGAIQSDDITLLVLKVN